MTREVVGSSPTRRIRSDSLKDEQPVLNRCDAGASPARCIQGRSSVGREAAAERHWLQVAGSSPAVPIPGSLSKTADAAKGGVDEGASPSWGMRKS